jgi:hypothetical protein
MSSLNNPAIYSFNFTVTENCEGAFFDYFIIRNIILKLMQEEYDLSDVKLYVLSQFKNLKGMTSQDCN